MWYLNILFITGLIGISLRYIILGKFEWNQLLILLLLPIATFAAYLIRKWQRKKDEKYEPSETREQVWYTHLFERSYSGKKKIFKGNNIIGEYYRYFPHKWQYIVSDMLNNGKKDLYLNLNFSLHNISVQIFQPKIKWLKANHEWNIIQDGVVIGNIKTDYSLKNTVKLREGLILNYQNETYYFKSFGIGSETKVFKEDEVIAFGKQSEFLRYQYEFEVKEGYEEIEPILLMTYILFNYVYNQ